jgi:hypothetical protein
MGAGVTMDKDRAELVEMARRVMDSDGTEDEIDALQLELERRVPMPRMSDLLFKSDPPLAPEEVIDRALAYKPIPLGEPSSRT